MPKMAFLGQGITEWQLEENAQKKKENRDKKKKRST